MSQIRPTVRPGFLALAATIACVVAFLSESRPLAKATDSSLPLRLVADIISRPADQSFSNQSPRMDYESIDPNRRTLYVAYLGADEIIAFDLATDTIVGHVQNVAHPHGTISIPGLKRLYVSATGTNEVVSIDERSLQVTKRMPGGGYPDGIAYDPAEHRIFVSDEHGGTDTVIDVSTNKTVDTIDLGGEVGNTQFDSPSGLIFSDVQTRDDIVAVNPKTDRIIARHALSGCDHDHGLLLDSKRRLAFVTCDGNAKLLLMDMNGWKELSTYDVGASPDVLAFDPGLKRLYVASESGVVAVFKEDGRKLEALGMGFLADEAHTVAVDPITHRVYFALQSVGGNPVIRVTMPTGI